MLHIDLNNDGIEDTLVAPDVTLAPVVATPVTYCQNATAAPLTATGSNLLWYNLPTGGTGSSAAPTPGTASPGTTTYYVSQTVNSLEGPRAGIAVTVKPGPVAAGNISGPASVCVGSLGVSYSITPLQNATSYVWNLPTGTTLATGAGTNSITVNFPEISSYGEFSVYATNQECSGTPSPTINISWNEPPTGTINFQNNTITENKYLCKYAHTIITGGKGTYLVVEAGGQLNLISNQNILLLPLTTVHKGGYLHSFITNQCENCEHITPTNMVLSGIVSEGQTMCSSATHTITVGGAAGPFIVQSYGSVTMIAGQNIFYKDGTWIQSGGNMWGYIAPNGPYCLTPSLPVKATTEGEIPGSIDHSSFKIYPNPTTGTFVLELKGESPVEKITIEVYGMRGEKVLTETLHGDCRHEFSLSGRPGGVYFVRVISGNKSETAKIIKQ